MTSRSAFTVMELLLVITLMAVLTSVITLDFGSLMRRSKINTSVARIEAALQQAYLSVQSGFSLDGEPLCSGLVFSKTSVHSQSFAWNLAESRCDLEQPILDAEELIQTPVVLADLTTQSTPHDVLYILFEPPLGHRRVVDALGETSDGLVNFSLIYPDTDLYHDMSL